LTRRRAPCPRDPARGALGRSRLRLARARAGPARAQIEPRISKRRRAGDPIPAGQVSREVWRGKKRRLATRDPQGRHRWQIERTNAWLKAKRRIATRRDVKDENYLAFLRLGMIHVLATSF
jgi:hypothetical protein